MKLVKFTEYAILDATGLMIYPDKKTLQRKFPNNQPAVSNYLSKHLADPGKKDDLVQLMTFLSRL